MFGVVQALEDGDDVQNAWVNGDVSGEILVARAEEDWAEPLEPANRSAGNPAERFSELHLGL